MSSYDDIRSRHRPESLHPKMRRQDRAKLFAPFAALNGYEESVHTLDHVLIPRMTLAEDRKQELDWKLRLLQPGDVITTIYFSTVHRATEGDLGEYLTVMDTVSVIDAQSRMFRLAGTAISFEDIADIRCDRLDMREDIDAAQ